MENPSSGRTTLPPATICFGLFELDVRAAELRKGAARIRLQDQPFQILLMLLEKPGEVVLREEIRNRLWPGDTVVEFDHSINTAVKRLRDALRESAETPRYIETLSRRGYRFIGQLKPATEPVPATIEPTEISLVEADAIAPALATEPPAPAIASPRFPRPAIVILALLSFALLSGILYFRYTAPARWARNVALPEATRLADAGNNPAAFFLLLKALQALPNDPAMNKLKREICYSIPIRTTPPGASIYLKPYANPEAEWAYVGQSPLENFALPAGYFRWKISKPGFRTVEGAAGIQSPSIDFVLDRDNAIPPEMVHVPAGNIQIFSLQPVHLRDFWIDKNEVTNRQFKEFVKQGGYQNRQYWREPFIKDGHAITWEQAISEFRDATGRPGPSTWEIGDYPPGREDFPVSGVSWYEAAAFAQFAKKELPTVYHWFRTAQQGIYSDILLFSNHGGNGPVKAGSRLGIGAFGTFDMAGNVKEWCWNGTEDRRYILGGGWDEPRASYVSADAAVPFQRSAKFGFRCVRYPDGPVPEALTHTVDKPSRDYATEQPVSDSVFRILQSFYSYDHTDLKAKTESVDDSSSFYRVQKVTFNAAYDHQRVSAWLFLPKNAKPPYQTVVYYPAGHAQQVGSIDEAEIKRFDFLLRSKRAVLFPVYQGTYERRPATLPGPSAVRDITIQQCKDLLRSVDFLETRRDVAPGAIAFLGMSGGAERGMLALTQEPRIRTAVLAEAGFNSRHNPPEIDGINFAPRVRIPILMLNGRYDFGRPLESYQLPMFRALGTPSKDKRHVLFESGHATPTQLYIKEVLDWFDLYLGPVDK